MKGKEMHQYKNKFVLLLTVLLFSGCASLPSDAPKEFTQARDALDEVNRREVDVYFPKTVQRANEAYDSGLTLLKENDGMNRMAAADYARQARDIARDAIALYSEMLVWDDERSAFDNIVSYIRTGKVPGAPSPFAKLRETEIVSTVAFFDTDSYRRPELHQKAIDSISTILKNDQSFRVILSGFADKRGNKKYNQQLALNRAKTVAASLRKEGVNDNQVILISRGESMAKGNNTAKYQLDRKVLATLTYR